MPYINKCRTDCRKNLTHLFPEHLAEFRPQGNMLLLSQGMPGAVEMVYAVGVFRRF